MSKVYQIRAGGLSVDGLRVGDFHTAQRILKAALGWNTIVLSESFHAGKAYAVECYSSLDAYNAAPNGDPYAPRIYIIDDDRSVTSFVAPQVDRPQGELRERIAQLLGVEAV